jgi:1-acyl-sn-glycerol-3-phosphate acyltransferase
MPHPALSYPRAAAFSLGVILATIVVAVCLLLARPLPYRSRYNIATYWSQFAIWWLRITCRLSHQLDGHENVPHAPVVVLCKHQSTWETILLTLVFRPQVWVLKREILWLPFFGWGIGTLNPIAIDRGSKREALRQVLSQGQQRLAHGAHVIVFPEGTRVPPGQRGRYGSGGVRLAKLAGVQIVPIAHNAGYYWPRKGFLKRPGVIRMVIGKPVDPRAGDVDELLEQLEHWIEATSDSLNPQQGQRTDS